MHSLKTQTQADLYDRCIELPMWMSTLSIKDESKPFHEQKHEESLSIIKAEEAKKRIKKEYQNL